MRFSVFYPNIASASRETGEPVPELLAKVRGMGITAVDTGDADLTPEAERQIADAGLGVSCIYKFYDFAHDPSLLDSRAALDRAARYGALFMVNPGFIGGDESRSEAGRVMLPALRSLAELARERGVTLCMEPFDAKNVPNTTADELAMFLENVPGLRLAFDTGNFAYAGSDVVQTCRRLREYIVHVHCKDRMYDVPADVTVGSPVEALDGRTMCACPVGSGEVPVGEVVDMLVGSGYDGCFAIELFGVNNIFPALESSVSWLNTKVPKLAGSFLKSSPRA